NQEFQNRKSQLQPLFSLRFPFARPDSEHLDVVFKARRPKAVDRTLLSPLATTAKPPFLVATEVPCQGNVELKATFDQSWQTASQVGVVLNASPEGKKGYVFLLCVPESAAPPDAGVGLTAEAATFAAVRKTSGLFRARIIRNGRRLADEELQA